MELISPDISCASELTASSPCDRTSACAGNGSARYCGYFEIRTTVPPSSSAANSIRSFDALCNSAISAVISSGVLPRKSTPNIT